MTKDLNEIIEKARTVTMTESDKEAQRRSFAYGNANIENKRVTREMVAAAAERVTNKGD